MSHTSKAKLNEFFATAISGNDILSSALYVSGIAIIFAGIYAPLVLAFIALVLYFYKAVYTEVVEALPINGGAYNGLLNGTSKTIAAIAGVTTILSYVATAVISAKTGIEYLHTIVTRLPVVPVTIMLLCAFALLVITGLRDSAKVAAAIFVFHIFTLVTFVVAGIVFYGTGHSYLAVNAHQSLALFSVHGGVWKSLYLAFSASLLGVSGFESSANFVEEQKKGVFRKTLRNMLIGIVIFNPLIALVALNTAPISVIAGAKDFLLADLARILGGSWLQYLVVIDAFLVLAGAVLTSFVGVSGLAYRMAADACLPGFLTKQNNRGSYPRIVIAFAALCISILLITRGDLLVLAGVYTIAFLSVMSLFAFGNLILRETRTELKRTYSAPLPFVLLALLATIFGISGNIRINVDNLRYFELYFIPAMVVVFMIISQETIVRALIRATKPFSKLQNQLKQRFARLTDDTFVIFVHHVSRLYEMFEYINRNETGRNIILVHCENRAYPDSYKEIHHVIEQMQKAGAFTHFKIRTVYKNKPFGPAVVAEIAKEHNVPNNRILIGTIHREHPFDYDQFEGVRIVV